MKKKWTRYIIAVAVLMIYLLIGSACASTPDSSQTGVVPRNLSQQTAENQYEKSQRLINETEERLNENTKRDSNNTLTVAGIEEVLQPQVINEINEITDARLSEPHLLYWFKLNAIYKGYDKDANRILLQDLGQRSDIGDSAWGAAFGIDANVYPLRVSSSSIVTTFPTDANAVATFYLLAIRFTENQRGQPVKETHIYVRFVRNIEEPYFNPGKFIVANGMHYITVNDAHVTTQEDVMAAYFLGSAASNSSGSVFDPIVYPLVDLMDARVAMDEKDIRNDFTFPRVRVKYVSEVIFRGQSNTTITVSTVDNVLTERMNFTGRASSVTNGERVHIYYTIAKDPLEKWEIQAIERF